MNEQTTTAIQPALFPLSAVQTGGYAQPEPCDGETAEDGPQPVEDAA